MKTLVLMLYVLLFVGCGEKVIYVPKTKVVYEVVPGELLVDGVNVTKPPNREVFVKAGPIERESILTSTIIELYSDIKEYKTKLYNIRLFNKKMEKLRDETYGETTKKP